MNKFFILLLSSIFFFGNAKSNSINGIELQGLVSNWLKSNGQDSNIEILANVKYPYCDESDMVISDISGSYKLIKVSCLGKNNWSFITRNKKKTSKYKAKDKNKVNVITLKNSKKRGTLIREDDIIVIKKRVSNPDGLVVNKSEIIGKKLKNSMPSNRPLHYSNLQKDWLIEKNSNIIIENNIGNIIIKDEGIALGNADYMEKIQVKNIKSGKIIQGFAKNEKKVVLKTKQFWIDAVKLNSKE